MKIKLLKIVSVILVVVLFTFLGIEYSMSKRAFPPEGLPNDYFELLEAVESKDFNIYLHGPTLPFKETLNVNENTDLSSVNGSEDTVLIVNTSWQDRSIHNVDLQAVKRIMEEGAVIIFTGFDNYDALVGTIIVEQNYMFEEDEDALLIVNSTLIATSGPIFTDNHKIYEVLFFLNAID